MARSQIVFYATARDLGSVLSPLEAERALQYTLTGLFDTSKPRTYLSYADIPEFGQASHPTAAANRSYLLSPRGIEVLVREVPQKSGGICYGIDQQMNEDTVVLSPAGKYGKDVILCGMLGTISGSAISRGLYNYITKSIRKSFVKKNEFYVGREAIDIWNAGARLTIGASSPPEFDLRP